MFLESKDHYNWTPYNNIKICLFYRDWLAVISPFILLKLLKMDKRHGHTASPLLPCAPWEPTAPGGPCRKITGQ